VLKSIHRESGRETSQTQTSRSQKNMIRRRGTRDAVMGIRWTLHVLFLSCLVTVAVKGASASSPFASASTSASSSLASSSKKTATVTAIAAHSSAAVKSSKSSSSDGIRSSATTATANGRQNPQHLGEFFECAVQNQRKVGEYHTSKRHRHRDFIRTNWGLNSSKDSSSASTSNKSSSPYSIFYYMRVGLAGGLAGASGTAVLYPMDCAKTLRQSQPETYKTVRQALQYLCVTKTPPSASVSSAVVAGSAAASSATPHVAWHIQRAYVGWWPAVVGAIPSSALYFGAYESMKQFITRQTTNDSKNQVVESFWHRLGIHATAAASGNMLSSLIFVPKELVKQQMQFQGAGVSFGGVLVQILEKSGVPGLYCGYQATLMRNIPSAMLRFTLYEELKYRWYTSNLATGGDSLLPGEPLPFSWQLFAAGACAGALASGIMTPVDVLKTRMSTGTCPLGVRSCLLHVVKEQGWKGMYAGAGSRMVWSGAFSAIGFGSFEAAKDFLGVSDSSTM
jgi:hypothetical protein